MGVLFIGCSTYKIKGEYYGSNSFNSIRIEIPNDSVIIINKNTEGFITTCKGKYLVYRKNKILINCKDIRGDSIGKSSITNILPSEFSINNEFIKIRKSKIIYKNFELKRVVTNN